MKKLFSMILLVFTLIVSCGSKKEIKADDDLIKIAVPEPLTGDLSQYGVSIAHGIELRAKEINANGGILGKKIKLYISDTKGDLQEAVNTTKELIANENVNFVLGESISSNSAAVANVANKAKIVMITPAGTAFDITENKPYAFRATFIDPYQGVTLAKYLNGKVKKIAVLTNISNDYSVGVSKSFIEKSEELGNKNINEYKYTKDDKDFKSILTNIKNYGADAVVIPDYYNTIGLILNQAKEVGLETQFYGGDGWDGITVNFAKVAEGTIYTGQFTATDPDPKVQKFIKSYSENYSEDTSIFSALGYDSMSLLEKAIIKANSIDSDKVQKALKEMDDDFITGHIKFDKNNNPEKEVKFLKVVNGQVVIIK